MLVFKLKNYYKMNRLYKILLILVVALASCNPMENINKQMDQQVTAPKAAFNYTLSSTDYASISSMALKDASNHSDSTTAKKIKSSQYLFGSYDHTYIPDLLLSLYPGLGNESNAHVTYNYYNGPLAATAQYETVDQYTLGTADYQSMGGAVSIYKYFSLSNPATSFIPDFLSAKYPSDTSGTTRLVLYRFANTDPAGGEMTIFDKEFAKDNSLGNFTATSVTGDQSWYATSYGAKMSGYNSSTKTNDANEDWLVSPAIDLSGFSSPSFQVSQIANYWNKTTYPDHLQILVSTDYSGDVTAATWIPLNITTLPPDMDKKYTEVESEKVDLSAYAGEKINIAFKYTSTTVDAATWEIDWMKVYGTLPSSGGAAPDVLSGGAYYQLSGTTWKAASDIYYLNSADYAGIGGSIGKYNDFSSSDNPDNYMPQFLAQKYPYAQEGDQMMVAYKYYSSGLHTYVDQYTFMNSLWTKYDPVTIETSPFVNTGIKWVFDPTVRFTMSTDDYQLIVDAVLANSQTSDLVDPKYKDVEYYYGADAYNKNFNLHIASRTTGTYAQSDYSGLSQAAASTLILQRVQDGIIVMLKAKFPNAVTQLSGVDVEYVVTYSTYQDDNSKLTYTVTYKCTKSGPNPEFTVVGDPVQD